MTTMIVAEAGVNHNGDMRLARALIDAAASAGADYVKFQTFQTNALVTARAPKAEYQSRSTASSQAEMLRRLELSRDAHVQLIEDCRAAGIGFLSTAFDAQSIQMLGELGLEWFKIPSGEITNLPYLRQTGAFGRRILLSTGMATLGDVESAIDALESNGTPRDRITVLHCTSEYPAPINEVNLRAMVTMGEAFRLPFGYSDHTEGIEVPLAAVALGATVIEKHLTTDRGLPGPDHQASLEPGELAAMIRGIRRIERAMGDGVKRVTVSERRNQVVARKSIVAIRAIRAGEPFSAKNLGTKRPGDGLSPMRWDEVTSRIALRDYEKDEPIDP
jgi:N,N'-diacetyllegionaminate synthase